jgi:uncharacterized protein (DUF983 family)
MARPDPQPLTLPRLLSRGIRRRCPLCGNGGCFRTFFEVLDRCPTCNFPLRRDEGHWIGAVGMNTIVSFGALLVTLVGGIALTWSERRAAPIFISTITVAAVVPIVFFGPSQTLWSAVDLAMRPPEPADDIDPSFIPPPVRRT